MVCIVFLNENTLMFREGDKNNLYTLYLRMPSILIIEALRGRGLGRYWSKNVAYAQTPNIVFFNLRTYEHTAVWHTKSCATPETRWLLIVNLPFFLAHMYTKSLCEFITGNPLHIHTCQHNAHTLPIRLQCGMVWWLYGHLWTTLCF